MVRKGAAWAAAAALATLLSSCGSGSGSDSGVVAAGGAPARNTVILRDIAFKPGMLTVRVGDTVTWEFKDQGIPHDVVAGDKSFKSEIRDSGTFRHTFTVAGGYTYLCTLHPAQMKGTVLVR